MKNELIYDKQIDEIYVNIKELICNSRNKVYKTVNIEMLSLYWNIGKMIVDRQEGNKKAKYGDYLIETISKKLTYDFGKGFLIQNLRRMRNLYVCFPICSTMLSELTWSHYLELIKIKEKNKRDFYRRGLYE